MSRETYAEFISAAAKKYGVPEDLIHGVIATESSYRPRVRSSQNARGLMQVTPIVLEDLGIKERVDLYDPATNIDVGTQYLAKMLERFEGSQEDALRAYNAGPTKISRWRRRGGDESKLPEETRNYPGKVEQAISGEAPVAEGTALQQRIAALKNRTSPAATVAGQANASPEASQEATEELAVLKLPDGSEVDNVPMSVATGPRAARAAWLIQNGHASLESLFPGPDIKGEADAAVQAVADKSGNWDRFLIGAGREFEQAGRGAIQLLAGAAGNAADVKRLQNMEASERALFERIDKGELGMEDMGQIAAWAPLIWGPTGILRQIGATAAGGFGGATVEGESRATNAIEAGAAGAVGGALGKGAAFLGRVPEIAKGAAATAVATALGGGFASLAAAGASLLKTGGAVSKASARRGMRELDDKVGKVGRRKPQGASWSRNGEINHTLKIYDADINMLRQRAQQDPDARMMLGTLERERADLAAQLGDEGEVVNDFLGALGAQLKDRTNSAIFNVLNEARRAGNPTAEQAAREALTARIAGGIAASAATGVQGE